VKPVIRPAARDDILRQFPYYLVVQDNPELARRFLSAVRNTIEQIVRMPHADAPKRLSREVLRGLRSWPVKRFEDVRVYYWVDEGGLRLIRVLHGKRDINRILNKERDDTPQQAS